MFFPFVGMRAMNPSDFLECEFAGQSFPYPINIESIHPWMYIAVYINVFTDLDMYTHKSKHMLYHVNDAIVV